MKGRVRLASAWIRSRAYPLLIAASIAGIAGGCSPSTQDDYSSSRDLDVAQVPGTGTAPESLVHLARSAADAGDYSAAVQLYRRAYAQDQENTGILTELGRTLAAMGAHSEAIETFRMAIGMQSEADEGGGEADEKPQNTGPRATAKALQQRLDAMQGLGNALIALDRPTQAVSQFEAALNLRELPRAYNGLGVAHDMLGDHDLAQAFYRTGLQIDPRNLSLMNNLGLSLTITGSFEKAIAILRRAAVDRRATSRQRLNLALAYGLAGKMEAAAEISRIDLDEASVRRNLAYYRTLRALNDRKAMVNALGAHGVLPRQGVTTDVAPPLAGRPWSSRRRRAGGQPANPLSTTPRPGGSPPRAAR